MARTRKQAKQSPEQTLPEVDAASQKDVFDEVIEEREKQQALSAQQQLQPGQQQAAPEQAGETSTPKEWRDRSMLSERVEGETTIDGKPVKVGVTVRKIDNYNKGGLGLKLEFDDPSLLPSEAAAQIIKAKVDLECGESAGYHYRSDSGKWHEDIMTRAEKESGVDPTSEAITTRANEMRQDQERRFVDLVGQLEKDIETGSFRRRAAKTAQER